MPQTLVRYARDTLARAAAADASIPCRRRARLPALDVEIRCDHGPLAEAMAGFAAGVAAAPDMQVRIVHPGLAGIAPPAEWGDADFGSNAFADLLAAEGLRGSYFHELRFWQFYDPASRQGVQLMAARDAFPPWETGAPLRAFLHWYYAALGMRLTHAGTLGHGGRGVLLAGAGGAGKSGTVAAGLVEGLDSVGDDYVLVQLRPQPRAHRLFDTLKQDPAGFARLRLARVLPQPGPLNWQGKHEFRIGDLARRAPVDHLALTALLLPRIGGGARTTISPAPASEAMLALAPSAINQMPGDRLAGFRFFGALTRSLPCFRLTLGHDAAEIAAAIAAFIEGDPASMQGRRA
ncbi:hypothetical protein [Solimonas soli]|uniref:hypothetical protein n=1 Tax=Solimonas soli TaxID=413479 RepID=UPI001B7FD7AB|nr:hypothetical protein [Solimonas soli]